MKKKIVAYILAATMVTTGLGQADTSVFAKTGGDSTAVMAEKSLKTDEAVTEWKFDFNVANVKDWAADKGESPTAEGWTGIGPVLDYNVNQGYGWKVRPECVRARNAANADATDEDKLTDLITGGEFALDVKNGKYEVTFYMGDVGVADKSQKATFTAEGSAAASIESKGQLGKATAVVEVEDGQLNVSSSGYWNAIEVKLSEPAMEAPGKLAVGNLKLDVEDGATADLFFEDPDYETTGSYKVYSKGSADTEYREITASEAQYVPVFSPDQADSANAAQKGKRYMKIELELGDIYQVCMTRTDKETQKESPKSASIEIKTIDESAPELTKKVQNLTGSVQKNAVTLTWDASDEQGVYKYAIYRSNFPEGTKHWLNWEIGKMSTDEDLFVKVGESKTTTYTDTTAVTSSEFYYKVAAVNSRGEGPKSDVFKTEPAGEFEKKNLEKYSDRAVVGIDLAGDKGASTFVSATDADGKEYTKGVYLSWRSFAADFDANGNLSTTFDVFKGDTKIASAIKVTNLIDPEGTKADTYRVVGSTDAAQNLKAVATKPWDKQYLELTIQRPEDETMPVDADGKIGTCNYSANDMSVGDVDGDGVLDLIVKWYPSNAQDNSKGGYTGKTFIDSYKINYATGEATLLSRIDMGINIRSGAHYTQFQVWDFDGDGKAELAAKTSDGTTTYKPGSDGKLQMVDYVGAVDASKLPVETQQTEEKYDYRNQSGHVIVGREFFSIFNLDDGTKAAEDIEYKPERGPANEMDKNWGDSSGKDNWGNRSERYLSGVAYLDGENPYAVFGRGYYSRTAISAWYLEKTPSGENGKYENTIQTYWIFDSGNKWGAATDEIPYIKQGAHSLAINDVDGDGRDEIIYGALIVDNDGTVLNNTGLEHGDAEHVSDWIPDHPGLEVMMVHEHGGVQVHVEIHDALTGEILMGYYTGVDTGRGVAADIDPSMKNAEFWAVAKPNIQYDDEPDWDTTSGGLFSTRNWSEDSEIDDYEMLEDFNPPANFTVFWDGDLMSELQDHRFAKESYVPIGVNVLKWDYLNGKTEPLLYSKEIWTNNGTKGNVGLAADILGDWRDEIITRTSDELDANGKYKYGANTVRIYTTTIQTDYVVPCQMENLAYREAIAWQNVGYNQPANLDYLLSEGVVTAQLTAKPSDQKEAEIVFTEANDGVNGHKITKYNVYRAVVAEGKVGEYKLAYTVDKGKNTTIDGLECTFAEGVYTLKDTAVENNTTYSYQIAAVVETEGVIAGVNAGQKVERDSYLSRAVEIDIPVNIKNVPEITLAPVVQDTPCESVADLLPKTVTVADQDGKEQQANVTWDVSKVKLDTPGTYKVTAAIQGWAEKQELDLVVEAAKLADQSIKEIRILTTSDVSKELPKKMELTFTNTVKVEADLTWDASSVAAVDKTLGAETVVTGQWSNDTVNISDKSISITVKISEDYVVSMTEFIAEVDQWTDPADSLPAKINAVFKSGKKADIEVEWDMSGIDATTLGSYEAVYTNAEYNVKEAVVVNVVYPAVYKFDFGLQPDAPAGWTAVTSNKSKTTQECGIAYTAEQKWGFTNPEAKIDGRGPKEPKNQLSVIPKEVYWDCLLASKQEFKVDLPNGSYEATVIYGGSGSAGGTGTGTFHDGQGVSVKYAVDYYGTGTVKVDVTEGSLVFTVGNNTDRLSGMIIRSIDAGKVTGISLDQTELTLTKDNKSATLTATVEAPHDVTARMIQWTSSDESVATVKDGVVTAVATGDAIITAKAGDFSATAAVTVNLAEDVQPVDKTALANALAGAAVYQAADYTADSFKIFTDALEKANAVYAKADAAQAEVDEAAAVLANAIAGLKKAGGSVGTQADKTALAKAIADAAVYKASDYTAESYKVFTDALANANNVNANANATQAEVDNAMKALTDAIAALVKAVPSTVPAKGQPVKAVTGDKNAKYTVTGSGTTNTVAFAGTTSKKIDIPDTIKDANGNVYKVTSIDAKAITASNKKNVTSIKIGNNITKIDKKQFAGFTKLTTVTIGGGVTSIGNDAFSGDKKLNKVTIGKKVKTIGNNAFKNCAALKNISIPNSTTKIGSSAFAGCSRMTKLTIGTGLTTIGKEAFKGDKKLATIKIKSKKIKSVGRNAFKSIKSNAKFTMPKGKASSYKKKYFNSKAGVTKKMSVK